jgi:hypothetical protein
VSEVFQASADSARTRVRVGYQGSVGDVQEDVRGCHPAAMPRDMPDRPAPGALPSTGPTTTTNTTQYGPTAIPPTSQDALDCACSLYFNDPAARVADPPDELTGATTSPPQPHIRSISLSKARISSFGRLTCACPSKITQNQRCRLRRKLVVERLITTSDLYPT